MPRGLLHKQQKRGGKQIFRTTRTRLIQVNGIRTKVVTTIQVVTATKEVTVGITDQDTTHLIHRISSLAGRTTAGDLLTPRFLQVREKMGPSRVSSRPVEACLQVKQCYCHSVPGTDPCPYRYRGCTFGSRWIKRNCSYHRPTRTSRQASEGDLQDGIPYLHAHCRRTSAKRFSRRWRSQHWFSGQGL